MKTSSASANPSFARLEQRIANQERRITQGVNAGTLTADEAKGLRDQLHSVQTNLQNDRFDGDGAKRTKDFAKQLNGLSKDIHTKKHDDQVDLGKRAQNIESRIAKGAADGSLTADEAASLKTQADQLRSQLSAAKTPEDQKALAAKYQELSKSVHKERHDDEVDRSKRIASFTDRINAGVADGSLNQKEADRLSSRVNQLGASDTFDAKTVNGLSRSIFHQRHDGNMNVPNAVASMTKQVDAMAASGKLTADQASAFKAQLVRLGTDGAQAAGPQLNVLRAQIAAAA